MNTTQWAGDYIAAGITGIAMDVNNFGPSEVSLRLAFVDLTGGGAPNNIAFSTETIEIVPGSGWTHIVFPVTPADLTVALGSTAGTLQNATELRLFHNPLPAFGPDLVPAIAATLGVDNIQAVPEFGGTAGLLSTGLASLALAGRRRRCSIGLS